MTAVFHHRSLVSVILIALSTAFAVTSSCGSTFAPNASMNASWVWPTWCR